MKKSVWLLLVVIIIGIIYVVYPRYKTNDMDHSSMNHEMTVSNDKDFILKMIPHHMEAIETSKILLSKGEYEEDFRMFLEAVVQVQSEEVTKMKTWYKEWFSEDFEDDGSYEPMMPENLSELSMDEAKTSYIKGMILHHKGAIEMAKQALKVTTKREINDMANDIILVQSEEIQMLEGMLK